MKKTPDTDLQNQLNLYKAIIDYSNAIIGVKDLDGKYLFINKELSQVFNIDLHNFLNQTDYDFFEHHIAKALREADQSVIDSRDVITVEEKLYVGDNLRNYLSLKFPIFHDDGTLFATGIIATDITERKEYEAKINNLAHTDQLTQLSNRRHYYQRFDDAINLAERENKKLALLMIDLDKFKFINDNHGHQVGDIVLQQAASIFKKTSRKTDVVARLGGDEFAIILVHPANKEEITLVAQRIINAIKKPMKIDGNTIQIGASIGIAVFPDDDKSRDELIKKSDSALYEAKEDGRSTFKSYS